MGDVFVFVFYQDNAPAHGAKAVLKIVQHGKTYGNNLY